MSWSHRSDDRPTVKTVETTQVKKLRCAIRFRRGGRQSSCSAVQKSRLDCSIDHQESSSFGKRIYDARYSKCDAMSWDGLKVAKRQDEEIGFTIGLLEKSPEKPCWEDIALKSSNIKTP
jgi:hypothetical protein